MADKKSALYRQIPSVSAFLSSAEGQGLSEEFGEGLSKLVFRDLIEGFREEIRQGMRTEVPALADLEKQLRPILVRYAKPEGKIAINATGVLLHTGLGRSPMPITAMEAIGTASRFSILQVDPESGGRSLREEKIEQMLRELTVCQAATVLNNNAAATMIILNTLAEGKEVLISRGQLVEIGGSYRLPDVMAQSGAILREVGTTNCTHLKDYEEALSENTGAILHVHPSNYRIHGFSGTPSLEELCVLGEQAGVPVIADLGSGALVPFSEFGLDDSLTIAQALRVGAAITCSSGDKLIGGPQAGVICGRQDIVEEIRSNPYARMFRVCKMTLAGLEATLIHYVNGDFRDHIPLYQMLSMPLEELNERGEKLLAGLKGISGVTCSLVKDLSYVGGGSLPDQAVPSRVVRIERSDAEDRNRFSEVVSKSLRVGIPPVFCRVKDEVLIFDMRSLLPGDLETLTDVLLRALPEELSK